MSIEPTDKLGDITLYNADCMDVLRDMPDNAFSLAIVDVPYGIGLGSKTVIYDGKRHGNSKAHRRNYNVDWDNSPPPMAYFTELKRVSQNQIIWGANHFIQNIPDADSSCWIVWDKVNGENDFADCELAYTSFKSAVRIFRFMWSGMLQGDMKNKEIRYHPCQKPVALYKWLLTNYAKEGDTILDTHLGSGSIAIACHDLGFSLTGVELSEEYYEKAKKRIFDHQRQLKLF